MSRIPQRSIHDAPPASRALLESIVHASPTGQPLNFQAQMAHAPAVLASYVGLRRASEEFATLEPTERAAVMLTAAAALNSDYALAITQMLARRTGWSESQTAELAAGAGAGTDNERLDALLTVVRQAAADSGRVKDDAWHAALEHGWSSEQLAEAFASLGLIAYTAWFINYADAERDLPAAPPPGA